MKKLRLFSLVIIMLVTTLTLTSCNKFLTTNTFTGLIKSEQQTKNIYQYLKNKKTKELKNLFNEEMNQLHDLSEEIEGAYEFIDGEIVSYEEIYGSSGGESWRDSKMTKCDISTYIIGMMTDKDTEYEVEVDSYYVYEEKKEKEGVYVISIRNVTSYESAVELNGNDEVDINDDEYLYLIGGSEETIYRLKKTIL